jgi:hypothetical protein
MGLSGHTDACSCSRLYAHLSEEGPQSILILRDSNRWIGLIATRMSGKRSPKLSRWR